MSDPVIGDMRLPEPQISTIQTEAFGGSETRPKNISMMYIVKTDDTEDAEPTPTPDAVTVTPALITGGVGDTGIITAVVVPASMASAYPVSFTSSDTGVITVDSNGHWQITGGGNAYITASISTGMGATVTVNAWVMLTDIAIAPIPDMAEHGTYTLQLTRTPSGSDEPLVYHTTDNGVAGVSNGVVYGYNPGTATITVTGQYSGVSDSQTVTVTSETGPGGIGTYAFMTNAPGTPDNYAPGAIVPGSNLRFAGTIVMSVSPVQAGSWVCMGCTANNGEKTLFQRIA